MDQVGGTFPCLLHILPIGQSGDRHQETAAPYRSGSTIGTSLGGLVQPPNRSSPSQPDSGQPSPEHTYTAGTSHRLGFPNINKRDSLQAAKDLLL